MILLMLSVGPVVSAGVLSLGFRVWVEGLGFRVQCDL